MIFLVLNYIYIIIYVRDHVTYSFECQGAKLRTQFVLSGAISLLSLA